MRGGSAGPGISRALAGGPWIMFRNIARAVESLFDGSCANPTDSRARIHWIGFLLVGWLGRRKVPSVRVYPKWYIHGVSAI